MRQAVCDGGDDGLVRKVVPAAGDDDGGGAVRAARLRRRLDLRRHGRRASAQQDEAAKKSTPPGTGTDDGAISDSSADTGHGICLPACLSHGAVSVIGRRREMEDAVAIARAFLASASSHLPADAVSTKDRKSVV